MTNLQWQVDEAGTLELGDATTSALEHIDREWPPARPETDITREWRWRPMVAGEKEVFCVYAGADRQPVGIWLSRPRMPIQLEGQRYYRLDAFEIDPLRRGAKEGRVLGALTFALVAQRALELGATGVVLATWDTHVPLYARLGGTQRIPRGWTVPRDMVGFVFDQERLVRLKEMADDFLATE